jgi:alpha-tubulin suppressor-like RCC1 family protein
MRLLHRWGFNQFGQLGDGTRMNSGTPMDVIGLSSGVVALAAGDAHTCALITGGGVKCWGYGDVGQLGNGTKTTRTTPVDVIGLTGSIAALTAGGFHTCALTGTGGAKCWGINQHGELGDGTTADSGTPVDVIGLTGGVTALAAGGDHTCALTDGGGVKCWGYNNHGQLGDGTTTDHGIPMDVIGLTSGVKALAAGVKQTCAVMENGGVKCWGWNNSGQLGDGTTRDRSIPVDVSGLSSGVTAVAIGGLHTCALIRGGGIKCWGENSGGRLGDGTTDNSTTPVDVIGFGASPTITPTPTAVLSTSKTHTISPTPH